MTASRWTRYFGHAAATAALGLALAVASAPGSALAAEDEDSIWNLDQRIFKGFMRSLGLRGPNDEEIEYRERSPLVVPPTRDLPPPQTSTGLPAPNWPGDPVATQQRSSVVTPGNKTDTDTAARSLMPSQLNKGRSVTRRTDQGKGVDQEGNALRPSQLGFTGFRSIFSRSNTDETGTFTGEPPRATLTEPPPGYQTPSPEQPYGVTKRNEYGPARKTEDIPVGAPR